MILSPWWWLARGIAALAGRSAALRRLMAWTAAKRAARLRRRVERTYRAALRGNDPAIDEALADLVADTLMALADRTPDGNAGQILVSPAHPILQGLAYGEARAMVLQLDARLRRKFLPHSRRPLLLLAV